MSLTSLGFFTFISIVVFLYYGFPQKQKYILLVANVFFYLSFGISTAWYIVCSIFTVFYAAKIIDKLEKKDKKRKRVLQGTLLINFGLLALVKYTNFVFENITLLLSNIGFDFTENSYEILVPIGISFYTFQIVGYLLDVYWKRTKAEENIWTFATFVSFFPQIIQGPISKYKDLSPQFIRVHTFEIKNIKFGTQLIIWGLFKKIVIADTLGVAASSVLDNPGTYTGVAVAIGILAYGMQLYCDFSGGIDVVRGVAQLLDIHIVDNFKRPFFSESISEFWRRWHITLGVWMKDYVFYPMALSKRMNILGRKCQNVFGKTIGRKIPICIENLVVFFLVGVWHGASWHFIVYGLYNGFIIAVSSLLEPLYKKIYSVTRIDSKNVGMKVFRIVRTFLLVNIGWYFDDVENMNASIELIKSTFLSTNTFYNSGYLGLLKYQYMYALLGCAILFCVSLMKECGINVREKIDSLPIVIKWGFWIGFILMIPLMGINPQASNGFMYANF